AGRPHSLHNVALSRLCRRCGGRPARRSLPTRRSSDLARVLLGGLGVQPDALGVGLLRDVAEDAVLPEGGLQEQAVAVAVLGDVADRKSTRLNSSHVKRSYAVFCSNKKTQPLTKQNGQV